MTSLSEYFHTDWEAMTTNDWIGTILTVVIFIAMLVAYFQAFRPKNKDRLESQRYVLFDEDNKDSGEKNGGPYPLPR